MTDQRKKENKAKRESPHVIGEKDHARPRETEAPIRLL
jgi:hypothetical protein